jgi:xanthine dehydrogenase accessory factor
MLQVLLRGGGDLASGIGYRLHKAGIGVVITELPHPMAVRRLVSFSEAVYDGSKVVEGIAARLIREAGEIQARLDVGEISVLVDPEARILYNAAIRFDVLIDARLTKRQPDLGMDSAPLVIGIGPGFIAGQNCHAAVETQRGHTLGRVYWDGATMADTATPEGDPRRVLRSPCNGIITNRVQIGERVQAGQVVADIDNQPVVSPLAGMLRGLIRSGLEVKAGAKVGDVDVRDNPAWCDMISDKSLAIGGGVLEAILSHPPSRMKI